MKSKGYSLITGVLILSAIIIVALLSVASLNINNSESELIARSYHALRAFGDGCMEESFIRLKRDASFTSGSLSEGDNSCTINVDKITGDTYRISLTVTNTGGQSLGIVANVARTMIRESVNIDITSFTSL